MTKTNAFRQMQQSIDKAITVPEYLRLLLVSLRWRCPEYYLPSIVQPLAPILLHLLHQDPITDKINIRLTSSFFLLEDLAKSSCMVGEDVETLFKLMLRSLKPAFMKLFSDLAPELLVPLMPKMADFIKRPMDPHTWLDVQILGRFEKLLTVSKAFIRLPQKIVIHYPQVCHGI